jgi:hypothetical protein
MQFSYTLTGRGWGKAFISDSEDSVEIGASYLTDVLAVLLDAVLSLLDGSPTARCSWETEPGEWRWLFTRQNGDVYVRILGFDDFYKHRPDSEGQLKFETHDSLDGLANAIASGCAAVLKEYGESGFKELWIEHDFPKEKLRHIQSLLGS